MYDIHGAGEFGARSQACPQPQLCGKAEDAAVSDRMLGYEAVDNLVARLNGGLMSLGIMPLANCHHGPLDIKCHTCTKRAPWLRRPVQLNVGLLALSSQNIKI